MTRFVTITEAYRAYCDKFGSDQPIWTLDELRDWIHAAGKRYEELTDGDMDAAYEVSMSDALNEKQ